jgi:hypothetical protein
VFVKNIFGQLLIFSDFLLNYADPKFVEKIDLSKIVSSPTHYIAPNGVERILDLVFSCPLKNRTNAKTMIVFEHAGNRFADLPFRLLYYACSIWWSEIKEGKKVLSAIYFIVLRTGKPHRGPYPNILDWLPKDENGQILGFAPEIHYTVVDLPAIDIDRLCGSPTLRAAMGILKNTTEGHEEEFAQAMLPLTEIEDEQQRVLMIKEILDLVAKVYAAHDKQLETVEIYDAVTPLLRKRTKKIMKTFFEKLEEKGEARGIARGKAIGIARGEAIGIARGKAEGKAEFGRKAVLLALRKKFTRVPRHIETTIRQMSDPIALESLIGDVIVSQTLDEFATALK